MIRRALDLMVVVLSAVCLAVFALVRAIGWLWPFFGAIAAIKYILGG